MIINDVTAISYWWLIAIGEHFVNLFAGWFASTSIILIGLIGPDGINYLAVVPCLLVKTRNLLWMFFMYFQFLPKVFPNLITYPQLIILWNRNPFRYICRWNLSLFFTEAGEVCRVTTFKGFLTTTCLNFVTMQKNITKRIEKHASHTFKGCILGGFPPVSLLWVVRAILCLCQMNLEFCQPDHIDKLGQPLVPPLVVV